MVGNTMNALAEYQVFHMECIYPLIHPSINPPTDRYMMRLVDE
jgi:hypothetical protein